MAQKTKRWFVHVKESRTDGEFEWNHGFMASTTTARIVNKLSALQCNRMSIMAVKKLVDKLHDTPQGEKKVIL